MNVIRGLLITFFVFFMLIALSAIHACASTRGISVKARARDGSMKTIPLYSDYYALVIGCSNYKNGWPDIPNAVKDAKEVAGTLHRMGWKVDLLENPDGDRLGFSLNQIIATQGRKQDRALLIWYSGHGYTLAEADGTRLGYIVPVDAPLPARDELGFMNTAIDMRHMETVAKRVRSRHMLMVFDSCFSGAIFASTRAAPSDYIQEKVARPVRQFITAGTEDEQVPDRSVFKTVFLQGISDGYADRNSDGYVTGEELGAYLQEKVVNYSHRAQHPQYGKINNPRLDKGDFIFLAGGSSVYQESSVIPRSSHGTLKVETSPSGAVIFISGRERGSAPVTVRDISPGEVDVKARLSGYGSKGRRVMVRASRITRVKLFLDRLESKGRLYVTADPPDSMIRILNIGPLYHDGIELEAGRYHVEVSKSGYRTYDELVDLGEGEDLDLPVKLEPVGRYHVASGSSMPSEKTWTEPLTGMEFVWVPGGCYDMGQSDEERGALIKKYGKKDYDKYWDDERPVHRVCVDGFWMGRYEVTVKQWRRFIDDTGYMTDAEKDTGGENGCWALRDNKWGWQDGYSWKNPGFIQSGNQPVACVSYRDVQAYIRWSNRKSGREYRLPTEAEWEYAARADTDTIRLWGSKVDSNAYRYANVADKAHGWFPNFPCDDGYKYSAPVGSYRPNSFGLYDMLGNVWELCQDWYSSSYYGNSPRNNPQGPSSGSARVDRGGSWKCRPGFVRSADRGWFRPAYRFSFLGFRLALPPG